MSINPETVRVIAVEAIREMIGKPDIAYAVQHDARTDDHDPVDHPRHYTAHPSGIECIEITEHMNFCLGNAVKYIWRADLKGTDIEDLNKAIWYLKREIKRRGGANETNEHRGRGG